MIAGLQNRIAQDYVAAFARDGARTYIGNLDTEVSQHQWGDHALPLTVNHGGQAQTFVCSPRVGYIDYPLEELSHFPNQYIVPALRALVKSVDAVLSWCDVNRVVHVNNWMMSTNLPVDLDISLAKSQTERLADAYPTHLLAMRSLTWRHSAGLMAALERSGWIMIPSRQVFLLDDVTQDSLPRRDTRRDEKLWQREGFLYSELTDVSDADAERIATLYAMLYRGKYSRLNPDYTPRFIALTHAIGMIQYLVLRDHDGIIQGFGGMHQLAQHATMPLIGYNTAMDRKLGLYRLAFHAGTRYAAKHALLFNMSSGAGGFKRNRGAVAELEFTAFYVRHLPKLRQHSLGFLRLVANGIGAPLLQRFQL